MESEEPMDGWIYRQVPVAEQAGGGEEEEESGCGNATRMVVVEDEGRDGGAEGNVKAEVSSKVSAQFGPSEGRRTPKSKSRMRVSPS